MAIEIYETRITKGVSGTTVVLSIGDKPIDAPGRTFGLDLTVILPEYDQPLVSHVQREAILVATEALGKMAHDLLQNLPHTTHARPTVKK